MCTILPDRSVKGMKLLRRGKGVFSKTRRTLTSSAQFHIALVSAPEELTTAALLERYDSNPKHPGTVIPAHNCTTRTDGGYAFSRDWKPFPLFYKGKVSCKRFINNRQFPADSVNRTCPPEQYISDRRPRGISLQQPDSAGSFSEIIGGIPILPFLNGTTGYRTDSEDSVESPGCYKRIQSTNVHKSEYEKNNTVIPDICLERRSAGTLTYRKDL